MRDASLMNAAAVEAYLYEVFPELDQGGRCYFVEAVGPMTARMRMDDQPRHRRPGGTSSAASGAPSARARSRARGRRTCAATPPAPTRSRPIADVVSQYRAIEEPAVTAISGGSVHLRALTWHP